MSVGNAVISGWDFQSRVGHGKASNYSSGATNLLWCCPRRVPQQSQAIPGVPLPKRGRPVCQKRRMVKSNAVSSNQNQTWSRPALELDNLSSIWLRQTDQAGLLSTTCDWAREDIWACEGCIFCVEAATHAQAHEERVYKYRFTARAGENRQQQQQQQSQQHTHLSPTQHNRKTQQCSSRGSPRRSAGTRFHRN